MRRACRRTVSMTTPAATYFAATRCSGANAGVNPFILPASADIDLQYFIQRQSRVEHDHRRHCQFGCRGNRTHQIRVVRRNHLLVLEINNHCATGGNLRLRRRGCRRRFAKKIGKSERPTSEQGSGMKLNFSMMRLIMIFTRRNAHRPSFKITIPS